MYVCRIVFVSINFARSRDPAFYLIAVRILLNQSIIVYFFRTTSSSSFFFFLLSSSSLFRRFRPPTGQRDLRVVVVRSVSSKRVVNGRNDVHTRRTSTRIGFFFFSSFFSRRRRRGKKRETKKKRNTKPHFLLLLAKRKKCSTDIGAFRHNEIKTQGH